jgi:hypothetical protein
MLWHALEFQMNVLFTVFADQVPANVMKAGPELTALSPLVFILALVANHASVNDSPI